MKNYGRKLVEFITVIALTFMISIPTFAAERTKMHTLQYYKEMSDSELIQLMQDLNFNQDEINNIMQFEYARRENAENSTRAIPTRGFLSNPTIGQWHSETYSVHYSTIAITVAGIAGA